MFPCRIGVGLTLALAMLLSSARPGHAQFFKTMGDMLDIITENGDSLDPNYVTFLPKLWSPRASYEKKFLTFGFHPKGSPKVGNQFYPNRTSTLGLGLYYREFGVGIGFSLPNSQTRIDNLGITKSLDLTLNSYKARYGYDLFLYSYKGFFLARPGLFYPQSQVLKPYPQRADVKFFQIGGNYFHIMNRHRFSLQAPYMFVRKQRESAGSLLWMIGTRYTRIKGDSAIDTLSITDINTRFDFAKGQFLSIYLLPGYSYTFVFASDWFVNATAFAGYGLQTQYYSRGSTQDFRMNAMPVLNLRGAAGFNGDNVFFGGQVNFEFTRNQVKGTRLSTRNDIFRIIGGFRF